MSTNPWLNAAVAALYIMGVVILITALEGFTGPVDNPLTPVVALSLLVLSVAAMGYVFFYQPAVMLIDGKREDAVSLFLRTIAIFAGFIVVMLAASVFVYG